MSIMDQGNSPQTAAAFLEQWSGAVAIGLFALLALVELAARRAPIQASPMSRIATNFGLFLTGAAMTLILPLSIVGAAAWAERREIGLFNMIAAPGLLVLAVAIAARSFAAYWLHRASHASPLLWRLHRIHHSDRQVDVSLGLRHHPLELLPAILSFGAVAVVLGIPPWAALATELVMIAANYWEHLAVRLPQRARALLEPWLVLPETHYLHHSADRPQTDSNFSALIIVWDRMFGTFRPSSESVERIGLGDADDRVADNFLQQLVQPFRSS